MYETEYNDRECGFEWFSSSNETYSREALEKRRTNIDKWHLKVNRIVILFLLQQFRKTSNLNHDFFPSFE